MARQLREVLRDIDVVGQSRQRRNFDQRRVVDVTDGSTKSTWPGDFRAAHNGPAGDLTKPRREGWR